MRASSLFLLGLLAGGCLYYCEADFGQAIVDEALDALQNGNDGDPRSMEDLLHWAICKA